MRGFLPVARRSPANWIIVTVLVLAPVAALISLPGGTHGVVLRRSVAPRASRRV